MNPVRVQKRKMQYLQCESGLLVDYQLRFNKRSVHYPGAAAANVMAQPGAQVEGVVYHLLDEGQILRMDPFEGYPERYGRQLLPVQTVSGLLDVWVYMANENYIQAGMQPATWYLNHLLSGKEYLSPDYYRQLAAVTCLPDTDVEPQP